MAKWWHGWLDLDLADTQAADDGSVETELDILERFDPDESWRPVID